MPDKRLVWWCQACRECGHVHCAYPDECTGMNKIPFDEAVKRTAEILQHYQAR